MLIVALSLNDCTPQMHEVFICRVFTSADIFFSLNVVWCWCPWLICSLYHPNFIIQVRNHFLQYFSSNKMTIGIEYFLHTAVSIFGSFQRSRSMHESISQFRSYHWLNSSKSCWIFLVCSNYAVSPVK